MPMLKPKRPFDKECFKLARHFLGDEVETDVCRDLAIEITQAVETFLVEETVTQTVLEGAAKRAKGELQ